MKKRKVGPTPPANKPSSETSLEKLIKECQTLSSKVFRLDKEAEAQAAIGANAKLAELTATGVQKVEVNKGQTSLTITFGNGTVVPFTVNDVWKAWFGYAKSFYSGDKDPVMKDIWKKKEAVEAELRAKIAKVPQDQQLRALAIVP